MRGFSRTLLTAVGLIALFSQVAEPFSVTDMAGRTVSFPKPPRRVVCLAPGALRLIVYLQAQDLVVGVEGIEKTRRFGRPYRMAHPELADLPLVGPGGPTSINAKPDLEPLLAVKPDVVFVTYMDKALADEVSRLAGIPVVVLSYGRFASFDEDILNSLRVAGKVLGREERAQELARFVEDLRKDLQRRSASVPESKRPRAYVGGIGYKGAYGLESTELHYIPFLWNRVLHVAASVKSRLGGHLFLDKEQLLTLNPDVVFIDGGGLQLVLEDAKKHLAFYKQIKAFQTGRVYLLYPFNAYATNVETALVDAVAVGKRLYPEQFADVDLGKVADRIYSTFVGRSVLSEMEHLYGPLGGIVSLGLD
ncbi:iron complex transport system substrate-binding protein [Desulfosoma caldarium]|uniref:Iron complex transport system substrate-binding protein n=2 Tax=Desulfosoma caldarium TaxID=610254 RepID=A0A3N1UPY7_9BACT|nr:iron complex transport system substrate-binding protein [Desulfosoma caldarium]